MSAPVPDREQIERFAGMLFRHAEEGGVVTVRGFYDDKRNSPPYDIRDVLLNGSGLRGVTAAVYRMATSAAGAARPVVVAPPVAIFDAPPGAPTASCKADEAHLREGLAIVAEMDRAPDAGLTVLRNLLGNPTVVTASGGTWADPATGEVQERKHGFWRLKEPATTPEAKAALKRVLALVCRLVGGDETATTPVHPMRWPGTVHRKDTTNPRMCRIVEENPDSELALENALSELEGIAAIRGDAPEAAKGTSRPGDAPTGDPGQLAACGEGVPNPDLDWPAWNRIGMAFYRASGGSEAGFSAFAAFSARSGKDQPGETRARWEHYGRSPPDSIGFGTLVYEARKVNPDFLRRPAAGTKAEAEDDAPAPEEPAAEGDGSAEGPPWPEPLKLAAYHGLVGEVVMAIGPHTEADPVAILLQFLAAFGNAVGRGPYFAVEGDRHTTNLFVALVGETSKARKGTSWGRVRQLMEAADPDWTQARICHGLSSGEGLIWQVRDPVEKTRRDRKNGTVETVIEDEGVSDKRLLIVESEFASVLRVLQREGNTLSAVVRQAWDIGTLRSMTKNSAAVATGALVSIVGHITGDELRRYLDRTESGNGFANRFAFACVRRAACLPDGGGSPDLSGLAARIGESLAAARKIGQVCRDAEARALWHAVYRELSDGKPGMLGAVTARAEAQVTRLALLYALLDQQAFVGRVHLEAALEVWRYCEDSARFVFGDSTGDPVADAIVDALRQAPEGLSRTEINRLFSSNVPSDQITRALAGLAAAGRATKETVATGGRPTERWRAVR